MLGYHSLFKSMHNFNFKYRNTLLDIVDTFNYLGITYCYTGNFKTACKILAEHAMKGTFPMNHLFLSVPMNISTKLYIFDRINLLI